jgi:transposase-like protein
MRQASKRVPDSAEKTVRDIRRATRRHHSAEEKIRIVLEGLRGEDSIAELCRKEGINQNLYYRWSKEFLEAGKKRLAGDTAREATSDEVKELKAEARQLKEETITCEHREFPTHWPRIGGIDFGWDHPFAAIELVWDRDSDTVYVSRTYRLREATPIVHAAALRPWGARLPWAWPRDGRRETLEGAGVALANQYRAQGLDMLYEHAQFEDGSVSVEAGLMDMLQRMESGRFKVLKHLNDWWEEFRLYHRKDGKVVKEGDDLMSATRYGTMMLRFAGVLAPRAKRIADRPMGAYAWMA